MKYFNQGKINVTEKKKNRKLYLLIMLVSSIIIMGGAVYAYFSDKVTFSGEIATGTLKLNGTYIFYMNGTETPVNNIKNLNPGDVITIKADIENTGSKSAWVREKFNLDTTDVSLLDYFQVYDGEFTQADFASNNDYSEYLQTFTDGVATLPNKIINGAGVNAEIESGDEYNYLGSATYQKSITIYFLPTATNEAQGKSFILTITTQAIQFRNNNISEPNELAWSTVATAQNNK